MKTSNIQTTHPMAIIRGWVDRGVTFRDGTTTTDPTVGDLTVIGGTITDNGDGTAILTIGGSGGSPGVTPPWDYIVAASDSSAGQQSSADAVCDGTADQVEINVAIAAAVTANRPYRILLTPGTYTITGAIDFTPLTAMGAKWVVFEASATTIQAGGNMTTMIKLDPGAGGQIITCADIRLGRLDGKKASYTVTQIVNIARFNDNMLRIEDVDGASGIGVKVNQTSVSDYPCGNNKIDIEIIHNCTGAAFSVTGSTDLAYGFQGNTIHIGEIIACSDGLLMGATVNHNATYNTFICGVIEHNTSYGIRDFCGGNTFLVGNMNTNGTNLGGPTGMNIRSTFRVHIDLGTSGGTAEAAVLDQHYVQINGASYGRLLIAEKGSTPATPASGFADIYPKSDGFLYFLNDSGTETQLGAGGGVTGFATPSIVLGTAAAAGAATTVIRSDSTIVAFDATSPTTQAVGDSAATGSAAVAARRDHKHAITRPALDDLSDVVITSATAGDRIRYDGSNFVNSALRWEPHVAYDGTVVLDGNGDPVMVEVS